MSQRASEQAITVQHLVKRYGNFIAVDDVSFSIKEGEIHNPADRATVYMGGLSEAGRALNKLVTSAEDPKIEEIRNAMELDPT